MVPRWVNNISMNVTQASPRPNQTIATSFLQEEKYDDAVILFQVCLADPESKS